MMRTANPALSSHTFLDAMAQQGEARMSIQGTVNKTAILLACCVATASFTWFRFADLINPEMVMGEAFRAVAPWMIGGLIGGLVFALITVFKPTAAPITAPLYAGCEGLFLGGISAMFNAQYPGIVIQAIGLTFGVLAMLLLLYSTRIVKVTEKFRMGVFAATGAVCLVYLVSFVLGFFGVGIPMIHSNGMLGIGFSVVVVIIASLNLVLDFDFIEQGAAHGAPKHMEWYGAFGLMVTLVWLYLEILRLLAKLQSRD